MSLQSESSVTKEYKKPEDAINESNTIGLGENLFFRSETSYKPKSRVVWFVLILLYKIDEKYLEITRIDCCHDNIHQHFFNKNEKEIKKNPILQLDDEPEVLINQNYWEYYNSFLDDAEKNYESWKNGY